MEAAPSHDAKGRAAVLGTRLEIVDAEAETVRRIYEMFASGVTVPEMVKTLNADQVAIAKIGKLNSPWNQERIRRILRQETLRRDRGVEPDEAGQEPTHRTGPVACESSRRCSARVGTTVLSPTSCGAGFRLGFTRAWHDLIPRLGIVGIARCVSVAYLGILTNEKLDHWSRNQGDGMNERETHPA